VRVAKVSQDRVALEFQIKDLIEQLARHVTSHVLHRLQGLHGWSLSGELHPGGKPLRRMQRVQWLFALC
jgi:hypothetical protein